mgnify:CR=1 FL=1
MTSKTFAAISPKPTGAVTPRGVKTPTLNLAAATRSIEDDAWKNYPITDTPRKELW